MVGKLSGISTWMKLYAAHDIAIAQSALGMEKFQDSETKWVGSSI